MPPEKPRHSEADTLDANPLKTPDPADVGLHDIEAGLLLDAREIPGRYEEIREQGSGGIGRVFLVKDLHLGREIALKELSGTAAPGEATLVAGDTAHPGTPRAVRFLREARITAQLEHPSIVPIYEMGQRANGAFYYTMKLIRGRTLERAIEEAKGLPGRLDLLPHFVDLCQAIAYAHSRGVVHRDIKPANVLVGEFGETVVIDWGIASAVGKTERSAKADAPDAGENGAGDRLTRYGQSLGTPRYMSPEQIRGDLEQIAEPSDVYALGIILYEILTGKHPYHDSDASSLFADVLARDPADVRTLEPTAPAELAAICRRAMPRDSSARYRTASELVEDLKRFQSGALVEAYRYNTLDRIRRFVRRHAAVLATATIAVVALVVVGVFAVLNIVREEQAAQRALYEASMHLARSAVDNSRLEEAEEALLRAPTQFRGLEWGLVKALCHPERLILPHDETVNSAMYSPDGTRIVTSSGDAHATIWDAATGQKLHVLNAPQRKESFVRAVWSADGSLLVLTTWLENTFIYSARDYSLLRQVRGYAPALSPDGKALALATQDGEIIALYDPLSGDILREFPRLPVHVTQLAISADGRRLAAGISNGSVWVWSLDSNAAWHTDTVHAPSTRHVVFSANSAILLSSGADGRCILWGADSGTELRRIEGHESSVTWASFLPGDDPILTASADRTIRIWETASGRELARHGGFSGPLGFVAPSPDGSEFITHLDSSSGRICAVVRPVIPLEQQRTLTAHNAPVNCVAFSPDGAMLASGGGSWRNLDDDRVILWNTRDNTIRREIKTGHGPVLSVAWFPDGTRIATGNVSNIDCGAASVFDVNTGQCLRTVAVSKWPVGSVAVSPDGTILAAGSWDKTTTLWDVGTGELRALFTGKDYDRVDAVVFDPSGRLVATGGMEGYVRFYRVSDGQPEGELLPAEVQKKGELEWSRRICALAFSPDGTRLVAAGDTGRVTMWDMATRRQIQTFKGHKSIVWTAMFSHDGRRLITGGKDAAIWFWDVETGNPVMFLERHKSDVNALALRGDGGQMASAGNDGTVVLWPILPWHASE